MARILYISYDGLAEPLGQAQILEYLLLLSGRHTITLLTFEKPDTDPAIHKRLRQRLSDAGIVWTPLRYHKRFKLLSAATDTLAAFILGTWLVWTRRIQIIHARSYLPGAMGLAIKIITRAKLLFDIRGFWADQRADCGAWSRTQLSYRLAKLMERRLFKSSDAIVSLTRAALLDIEKFPYMAGRMPPSAVIPTCVNLSSFAPNPNSPRPDAAAPVIGFMGNVTVSYRLDDMAKAFSVIRHLRPEARLLVVNRGDHAFIRKSLMRHLPDLVGVEFASVDYHEVPAQIRRMSGAVFFLKEAPSMSAVCPTRLAEFLACGIPVLTNGGHGDARPLLTRAGAGVLLDDFSRVDLACRDFLALTSDPAVSSRCRALAEVHFSLAAGTESYDRLYSLLAS